jgi:hypothetical protein
MNMKNANDKWYLSLAVVIGIMYLFHANDANSCELQESMTNEQWYNVSKGYYAAKDVGYGFTLAAIIIRESQGGLYRVNPNSLDYGLTHINVKTAVNRMGYKDTPFMRSVAASKIVFDDDLAIALAIEELLYWHGRRGGEWKHVVASYNSGNNMKNGLRDYYPKISKTVNELKGCFEN